MKNLKKKTMMKSNIFGIEYTAEDMERMAQVMLSAKQFMSKYGKGMQPRVMGDVILNHTGNAGKVSEDENHKYTAFDAPAKYVKDIDLYRYTSLTAEEVHRAAKKRHSGMPYIDCRIYDSTRVNYGCAFCYEYNLRSVLRYEEKLKKMRKLEENGREKTKIICKYTSMFHRKEREIAEEEER